VKSEKLKVSKEKIRGVVFDMDGLMFDTEPVMSKSYELLIKEYGKEPIFDPKTGLIHHIGLGKVIAGLVKEKHGIEEDVEILRQKRRVIYYQILERDGLKTMPGLLKLLKLLKNKNISIALASNSPLKSILFNLRVSKVDKYFNEIISGENVNNHKPHPDVYLEAAKNLGLNPSECLALEDSQPGVESGKAAGMKVIAVPSKYTKHQDFSKADLIVNSLKDINWNIISSL
jgi:HAD superfamily hydrolase (TIGR01509 family)